MGLDIKNHLQLLSDPFDPNDIEWRVQQSGVSKGGKPFVLVIPYVTNRAIQKRLDDVFGLLGWENKYKPTPCGKGYLCGISIKAGEEWITKWDGAEFTSVEPLKGVLSNSMKRAAVMLGIGRYLYSLEVEFAVCQYVENRYNLSPNAIYIKIKVKNSNSTVKVEWFPPELPEWAMPSVESQSLIDAMKNATSEETLKDSFRKAYNYANSFKRDKLMEKVIAVKDAMKARIAQMDHSQDEKNTMKVRKFLERQVTEKILGAQNISVLRANRKLLTSDLARKCQEHSVMIKPMMDILETYYNKQVSNFAI